MVEAGKDSARNTLLLFCGWDVKNKNKGFAAVPVLASKALVLRESILSYGLWGVYLCPPKLPPREPPPWEPPPRDIPPRDPPPLCEPLKLPPLLREGVLKLPRELLPEERLGVL